MVDIVVCEMCYEVLNKNDAVEVPAIEDGFPVKRYFCNEGCNKKFHSNIKRYDRIGKLISIVKNNQKNK